MGSSTRSSSSEHQALMPRLQLRLTKQLHASGNVQLLPQARCLHRSFRPDQPSDKAKSKPKKKPTSAPKSNVASAQKNSAISLLDELFPELAKHNSPEPKPKPEREIPRLSLFPGEPIPPPKASLTQDEWVKRLKGRIDEQRTVLVLRSACHSLNENDFRRLVPKGKHIEGWRSEGDFEKVIPARDPDTLRREGSYFLIFSNPAAAKAYQENVSHLHRIARTYAPRSLQSPIPPPPGMLIEGEDVHSLIQSYALIPPEHNLRLNVVMRPLSPAMRHIVEHGGYPLVTSRPNRSEHEVLLSFDGEKQPTAFSIQAALGADGTARGRSWAFAGGWPPRITRLDMPGPWRGDSGENVGHEERNVADEDDDVDDGDTIERRSGYDANRKKGVPKWIVAMESDEEAKRFARSWHRRSLPTRDPAEYDGRPPLIRAELLW